MITIREKEKETPQQINIGISVSQAPGYMINTKIITFVPRFMI